MQELNKGTLSKLTGGEDLPINATHYGPSEAQIAAILALFTHPFPTHMSD